MNKERILAADDEPKYLKLIGAILRTGGYEVLTVADGAAAVEAVARQSPGLVLLDVRMPKLDGHAACRRIREFSAVPVIMLTALAEPTDVVEGLEAGADDYVTKPFTPEVLLARVRAALRRSAYTVVAQETPGVFETGDLRVDYARRNVQVGEQEIHLTPTEYRLLVTLTRAAGAVVLHATILEQVWGAGHDGEDELVRRVVHRLRQKIEPDPAAPRYIVTEGRGVGYFLNRRS
jgi:two-component system KDP operon response regulator KdpE